MIWKNVYGEFLFFRNWCLENEVNELNVKIKYFEEYKMKIIVDLKYLKELKDIVVNGNDKFKLDIVILFKEKDIVFIR